MQQTLINSTTNKVVNILNIDPENDIAPPDNHTLGPAGGKIGQIWNGTSYSDEPPTTDSLIGLAAEIRRVLTSGHRPIEVGDRTIDVWVDTDSRASLTALVVASSQNPAITVEWLGADGQFYLLNATEITALATGVMTFVQTAFAKQAAVNALIVAGQITTLAGVTAAFNA